MSVARDLEPTEVEVLKDLVNRCSLQSVIMALSEVCDDKAKELAGSVGFRNMRDRLAWASMCGRLGILSVEDDCGRLNGAAIPVRKM